MEKNQKPILKSGNIAVWPAKELDSGHKLYTVSFEKGENQRTYVSVFANIAGHELSPSDILSLSCDKPVTIEDKNQHGPRLCTIVNIKTESKMSEKDGKTYTNNNMILGVAYHKLDDDGHTFGYSCNGVHFYAQSGDRKNDQQIFLTPKDCFELLDGNTIFKDGREAFLRSIEEIKATPKEGSDLEGKVYKTARLEIQKIAYDNTLNLRENSEFQESEDYLQI